MEISVVVPVFNGERSLLELNKRIIRTLSKEYNKFEIIYVDDRSQDNSRKIIELLKQSNNCVEYIFHKYNYGQQSAIFSGLKKSRGEIIITIDDDLQHPPEEILLIINELKNYDGVFAFPLEKPHKLYRKWGSYLTNQLFNLLFKKDSKLKISSFRAIRRNLINRMIEEESYFVYISALMIKNSINLKTIYNKQFQRKYGNSNYNFSKLFKLYINIIIYYSDFCMLKSFRKKASQFEIQKES